MQEDNIIYDKMLSTYLTVATILEAFQMLIVYIKRFRIQNTGRIYLQSVRCEPQYAEDLVVCFYAMLSPRCFKGMQMLQPLMASLRS